MMMQLLSIFNVLLVIIIILLLVMSMTMFIRFYEILCVNSSWQNFTFEPKFPIREKRILILLQTVHSQKKYKCLSKTHIFNNIKNYLNIYIVEDKNNKFTNLFASISQLNNKYWYIFWLNFFFILNSMSKILKILWKKIFKLIDKLDINTLF